jgi:hypothetical protein
MPMDSPSRHKGFLLIEYDSNQCVRRALDMFTDHVINNRKLKVKEYKWGYLYEKGVVVTVK